MRFLCLHGMGTNSQIYEAQLAPIRLHLDPAHEFVFIDGLTECAAPAGVPNFFKGPFYCYYEKPTTETLQAAYDLVQEIIEEEGPFHGVFGFSQGGALAASLLLHHRKTKPHAEDLFNLAVFTCASLPFDLNTENQVVKYNTLINPQTGAVEVSDWDSKQDKVEPSEINGFLVPPEPEDVIVRRYHPEREKTRIPIPTVHIMGKLDPFLPQEQLLAELCGEPKWSIVHEKGHELPRDPQFGLKAATAINNAIAQAMHQH